MGAHRRHEEEKVCPLCIEVLDATEKSFFPCPCGYQVCLFCFDRLKNDCGNLCPGCRTEYGSANNPFTKRKSSNGAVAAAPASGSSRADSPVAAPPAAAATNPAATSAVGDAAGGTAGLTPLQQARQMHRAKVAAAQQAGAQQQPVAQQSASVPVVSRPQAAQCAHSSAPLPPPQPQQTQHQHQHQHQQSRRGGTASRQRSGTLESPRQQRQQHIHGQPYAPAQKQAAQQAPPPQLSLPSLQDVSLQPQTSLGSARPGWVQDQLLPPPLPPPGSRCPGVGTNSASMAFDAPLGSAPQQQPAQWLAPGSGAPFGGSHTSATANGVRATDGLFASANGTGGDPWGSDLGGKGALTQPQRRTAVAPRPLPLEGGPEVKAELGAEADLAAARLAVQCGQVSASDAAWNLLAARASVRAV